MNKKFTRRSEPADVVRPRPVRFLRIGRLSIVAAALGIILIGGWLLVRAQSNNGTLARAQREGVIRIGYAVEPPYAFLDATGKVTGEFPEVARVITARLGIQRIEWHLTDFDALIHGLEDRDYDVVAAGMFITPGRKERAAFSLPICKAPPALLVQKGNPKQLHSYADMVKSQPVRIAVLSGSVEEKFLLRQGIPTTRLIHVPDAFVGRQLVNAGEVDALALSEPTVRWVTDHDHLANVEMAIPFVAPAVQSGFKPGYAAFVFRKDDQTLVKAWNAELEKFFGTVDDHRIASQFDFSSSNGTDNTMSRRMTALR